VDKEMHMVGLARPALAVGMMILLTSAVARARGDVPAVAEGGYPVRWEAWSFKWKILPRQGVVLTQVMFQGRLVLKYAGVAEVFVPYNSGWPRPQDQRDHPFGKSLIPLQPGLDCLPGGECRAYAADGALTGQRAVVMIHEEAPSLVYLGREGRGRAKMLVLWSAYALGDYTYVVRWRFGEDGSILPEVGLTGKLSHFGGDATNSTEVGASQRALGHVHNTYFCLDFDVDGPANTVEEFNYTPAGPDRDKATATWTPITKETRRVLRPESFRSWRVVNHASRNRLGLPRSYEIVPGGTGIYRGARQEPFAHADLWVTKFKTDEVPGERLLSKALAASVNGDNVENEDVVTWYKLSVHHQPRTEDWSAMPLDWYGFKIVPRDFLDRSPVNAK
jgi:primary-amine oxidase